MANEQHIQWLCEGVEAWNARREETEFRPDFSSARDLNDRLRRAGELTAGGSSNLRGANLRGADLGGANLAEADLEWANLRRANLAEANLGGANLNGTDLQGADLAEANLAKANLGGANASEANLRGAKLSGTNFNVTNLRGADVRSVDTRVGTNNRVASEPTDLSKSLQLSQPQLDQMRGDRETTIPSQLERPVHWLDGEEYAVDTTQFDRATTALELPVLRASAIDFEFSDKGIEATTPPGHAISVDLFDGSCAKLLQSLKLSAERISQSVSNKLGDELRTDLLAYADHIDIHEESNASWLHFLAEAIRADTTDPIVSDAFDTRLKTQLKTFLSYHDRFLEQCVPAVYEAVETKAESELSRRVTKEEVTAILDDLEAAILSTEMVAASTQSAIDEFRKFDDALNDAALKAYGPDQTAKVEQAVQKEAKELAIVAARAHWRARQLEVYRSALHDGAAIATIASLPSVQGLAISLRTSLEPLMQKLTKLLPSLPNLF